MNKLFYITTICFLAFFACSNDDDFSSDANIHLEFSSDIIQFDTVFSTIGSATKQFKIYNRNNHSAKIETIELMNPSESGFRMNIDGEKGTRLTNVEILKKDSLFGFIEVTVNPQNSANPVLIKDSIKFTTNGNIQYLQLRAIGQDVYIWKGETITKDSILTAAKPFLVYDSIVVKKNAKATIKEGVKFFFKRDASVNVHGTINIQGSVEKPVVFRTERFDKIEGDIPYDNVPGQWDGIYFFPESYDNNIANAFVRGATKGMTFYSSDANRKKAILYNTIVHNTSEYGVLARESNINAENCLFTNSKNAALSIQGGKYSFIHCTIANHFAWSGRKAEALVISNYTDNGKSMPLDKCDFINCIVWGSSSKEILFDPIEGIVFEYEFKNCILKGTETSGSHFSNIIWNKNPLFKDINQNKIYSYNFELEAVSPAINEADRSYSITIPFDLKGKSRLTDTNPDMGCYEWIGQ